MRNSINIVTIYSTILLHELRDNSTLLHDKKKDFVHINILVPSIGVTRYDGMNPVSQSAHILFVGRNVHEMLRAPGKILDNVLDISPGKCIQNAQHNTAVFAVFTSTLTVGEFGLQYK